MAKKKKIPVEAGVCPVCGDELSYDGARIDEELIENDWNCLGYKAQGTEHQRMVFSSHSVLIHGGVDGCGYKSYRAVKKPIVIEMKGGCASVDENPTDNPVVIRDLD